MNIYFRETESRICNINRPQKLFKVKLYMSLVSISTCFSSYHHVNTANSLHLSSSLPSHRYHQAGLPLKPSPLPVEQAPVPSASSHRVSAPAPLPSWWPPVNPPHSINISLLQLWFNADGAQSSAAELYQGLQGTEELSADRAATVNSHS